MKYEIIKGSEKDFELAPQWVTLKERNTSGDLFFSEGHSVGCRVQGITTEHDFTVDDGNNDFTHLTLIAERRPITEPVWDGEGLPPVGVECELYDCEDWHVVKVKFIGDKYTVIQDLKFDVERVYCVADKPDKFRPIRSPEDVARDEAIDDLVETIIYFYGNPKGAESYRGLAVRIIEAIEIGKIPGVKLEGK